MQALLAWVKNFLFFILILSFFEMLLPATGIKPLVKWLMGLIVLTFILRSFGGVANLDLFDWEKWFSQTTYTSTESIVAKGQKIAEGGEAPLLEAIQRDFNQNLKSLILVMDGVRDAEVVTQLGPKGQIQQVIATITTTNSSLTAGSMEDEQDREVQIVGPVEVMPIAVNFESSNTVETTNSTKSTLPREGRYASLPLAAKIRKFIATYYRLPESAVKVVVY